MNNDVSGKIRDVFNNMSEVKAYIDALENDKIELERRCSLWDETNKKLREEISDHHKLHNANKLSIEDLNERINNQAKLMSEQLTKENGLNTQIDILRSENQKIHRMLIEEQSMVKRVNVAVMSISEERFRQHSVEGFDSRHDDRHMASELIRAAVCYAMASLDIETHYHSTMKEFIFRIIWPWDTKWWKPSGRRRNLVKAGALIVAEIERLDRIKV